jgi:hypothetical protein
MPTEPGCGGLRLTLGCVDGERHRASCKSLRAIKASAKPLRPDLQGYQRDRSFLIEIGQIAALKSSPGRRPGAFGIGVASALGRAAVRMVCDQRGSFSHAGWLSSGAWVAIHAACLTFALATGAAGQVRGEPEIAATISPDSSQFGSNLFARDGDFLIAGGVVLHGNAIFMLEENGRRVRVAAGEVMPIAEPGGRMALGYQRAVYQMGMPAGLACPLGRFVARQGTIAYTIVHYMDDESPRSLMRAGLVRHRLAREFAGTRFEPLLRAADLATTEKLPDDMGASIAASINAKNGIGALLINTSFADDQGVGSFLNSDFQVTYRTYLMAGENRVEVAGVPLRYFWQLEHGGAAGVFSVESLAQNWQERAQLSQAAAAPAQYDVVNFYQVAGVFRKLQETSPAAFGQFVEQACAE